MKQKVFLLTLILLDTFIVSALSQNNNSTRTPQDILMTYKWHPVNMYEDDDKESCFLIYTKTQEIDSTTTEDGELNVYITTYYFSETPDTIFDPNKVGKATDGKYLIMGVENGHNQTLTFTYELIELSDRILKIKNITQGLDTCGRTSVFLAIPK